jgi:hypothetical protein
MGGGYAEPIEHTVHAQAHTVALALAAWRQGAGCG